MPGDTPPGFLVPMRLRRLGSYALVTGVVALFISLSNVIGALPPATPR